MEALPAAKLKWTPGHGSHMTEGSAFAQMTTDAAARLLRGYLEKVEPLTSICYRVVRALIASQSIVVGGEDRNVIAMLGHAMELARAEIVAGEGTEPSTLSQRGAGLTSLIWGQLDRPCVATLPTDFCFAIAETTGF